MQGFAAQMGDFKKNVNMGAILTPPKKKKNPETWVNFIKSRVKIMAKFFF